ERQRLHERRVEMRQLLLIPPIQVGDIQIVEVRGIVDRVRDAVRAIADRKEMERSIARGHRRKTSRPDVDAIDLAGAFESGFEVQRATALSPAQASWNQIESLDRQT